MNDLTVDDQWRWWSYHYGFRRAILNDVNEISPIDTNGEWFNPAMASQAERYYRRAWASDFDKRYQQPPFAPANLVRENWRQIRSVDLTDAEHALADPAIAALAQQARDIIEEIVVRSHKAFREDTSTRRTAQEPPQFRAYETAAMTPELLGELMGKLADR